MHVPMLRQTVAWCHGAAILDKRSQPDSILVCGIPRDRHGCFRDCDALFAGGTDRNYVPVIERQLGSEPKPIVVRYRSRLIVEHPNIAARSSLTNDYPHPFHETVLLTLYRNFEHQLREIARSKNF